MDTQIIFSGKRAYDGKISLAGVPVERYVKRISFEAMAGELTTLVLECHPQGIELVGDPVVYLEIGGRRFRVVEDTNAELFSDV